MYKILQTNEYMSKNIFVDFTLGIIYYILLTNVLPFYSWRVKVIDIYMSSVKLNFLYN